MQYQSNHTHERRTHALAEVLPGDVWVVRMLGIRVNNTGNNRYEEDSKYTSLLAS